MSQNNDRKIPPPVRGGGSLVSHPASMRAPVSPLFAAAMTGAITGSAGTTVDSEGGGVPRQRLFSVQTPVLGFHKEMPTAPGLFPRLMISIINIPRIVRVLASP